MCGDADGVGITLLQFFAGAVGEEVNFVEDKQLGLVVGIELAEDVVHGLQLCREVGHGGIGDVQQDISVTHFLESGFEGFDEAVGQVANEADRINKDEAFAAREAIEAGGGVECGEEFVFDEHVGAGQGVEQSGFAGVGVSDEGDHGKVSMLAAFALFGALALHESELLAHVANARLHAAAIDFELLFAWAACADAAVLP